MLTERSIPESFSEHKVIRKLRMTVWGTTINSPQLYRRRAGQRHLPTDHWVARG
jgi:hypothetical protein